MMGFGVQLEAVDVEVHKFGILFSVSEWLSSRILWLLKRIEARQSFFFFFSISKKLFIYQEKRIIHGYIYIVQHHS